MKIALMTVFSHRRGMAGFFSLVLGLSVCAGADQSQLDPHQKTLAPGAKAADVFRILCIGDSITLHGCNADTKARLGWDHVAGMAATDQSKDYAHLLAAKIQAVFPARRVELYFDTFGGSGSVRQRLMSIDQVKRVEPDLVVVQLGEHEKEADGTGRLTDDYERLLTAFSGQAKPPMVIATGVWSLSRQVKDSAGHYGYAGWAATIDKVFSRVCAKLGVPFVPVNAVALNPACRGWGTVPGVRWHPNDRGHAGYADLIFAAFVAKMNGSDHGRLAASAGTP